MHPLETYKYPTQSSIQSLDSLNSFFLSISISFHVIIDYVSIESIRPRENREKKKSSMKAGDCNSPVRCGARLIPTEGLRADAATTPPTRFFLPHGDLAGPTAHIGACATNTCRSFVP
ncbi:hypothetical protein D1007_29391 [Hordeum vulgare]|nr:hypothetical protein D1007_29391 [Hordeum vulgare]